MESAERGVSTIELIDIAETLDLPYAYFVAARDPAVTSRRQTVGADPDGSQRARFRLDALLDEHLRAAQTLRATGHLPSAQGVAEEIRPHAEIALDEERALSLAHVARGAAGLDGPISSVRAVAELFGFFVFVEDIDIDGGSRSPSPDFGVAVVRGHAEPGRRRTTAVHELGHHVIGDAYNVDVGGADQSERERLVDVFASEFLLPSVDLRHHVNRFLKDDPRWETGDGKDGRLAAIRDALIWVSAHYRTSWGLALQTAGRVGVIDLDARRWMESRIPLRADFLRVYGTDIEEDLDRDRYGRRWTKAVMAAHADGTITKARARELLPGADPFAGGDDDHDLTA